MPQSGFTPLQIYSSSTASNVPSASNLVNSTQGAELAINIADGKLFYKDNAGVVQVLATKGAAQNSISFGTTGLTPNTATQGAVTVAGTLITSNGGTGLTSFTAGDLPYYSTGTALSKLAIGTNGYILQSNGSAPTWVIASSVIGGAGGSNTQVQYNSSGSLAGSANMTFSGTALALANDASISGLTVGKGGGAVSTNTAVGNGVMAATATGGLNTGVGYQALTSNTSGTSNTALGRQAGYALVTGTQNTAVGANAMDSGDASYSVAVGYTALSANSGSYNVAVGNAALKSNTTASNNTAVGYQAGYSTTTAASNCYFGYQTGYSLTASSGGNTFGGYQAGYTFNSTSNGFHAMYGYGAGYSVSTGLNNTLIGANSGYYISSGSKNTVLGSYNGNQGGLDIRTASNYIVLSDGDGNPRLVGASGGQITVGSNISAATSPKGDLNIQGSASTQTNLYLFKATQVEGYVGFVSGSNSNLYINTGSTMGSTGVYMTNGGTSWTSNSDERLKENLVPITDAVTKVNSLRSVIGNFIADENKTPRPFLIAQDVQSVLPEAVSTSEIDGTEYLGVSYTEVVPLLVAAIKELNAKVTALETKLGA